jgi:hypothetical protein
MTQQSTLGLAKQGDIRAIASVVSYILKDNDVKVRANIRDGCIFLILESSISLEKVSTINTIEKILNQLAIPEITTAKVQSKLEGVPRANWLVVLNLATLAKSPVEASINSPPGKLVKSQIEEVAIVPQTITPSQNLPESQTNPSIDQPENQQNPANIFLRQSQWSPWFPYPSSWLRTLGLIIWLVIVVHITTYWARLVGIVMSTISDNLAPLFNALLIALVISITIFAYINHILFGRNNTSFNPWQPSPRSWWEGIYAPIVAITSLIIACIIIIPFIPITDCNFNQAEYLRLCINSFERYSGEFVETLFGLGIVIGIFTAAYLYQIEFLIRKNFSMQKFVRFLLIGFIAFTLFIFTSFTIRNQKPIQSLLQSAITETMDKVSSISPAPQVSTPTPDTSPLTSGTTLPNPPKPNITTPLAVNSFVPEDPFAKAIENALQASKLVQVAKTKAEWQNVAVSWETAINFLIVVPESHPQYQVAQQKIKEYQSNLDYARLAGSRAVS